MISGNAAARSATRTGIVGRTEVLIGTVRTEIGPAMPQISGQPIVFEMTVKPSGGSSGVDGMTDERGQGRGSFEAGEVVKEGSSTQAVG
ncbi:MAG: hypothetical protein KDB52_00820 [Solirubrobacterales bacterium]|nr:hypothetical protein [Solirubrobacterales bacterium]